ncbi:MAG: ATP/GTP-binding protein [Candidatus Heimdallarchaeota archaeon]|nr:ATP/GTP-binding protein [Candidatus Heimdallarchaeota archaeon]MBY8995612.1 ATP/GTP-binding protein [Candidatus Heimdallarchaeota archaeon]
MTVDIEFEVKKLRILTANNVLNTYPYLSGKLRGVYKVCVTGSSGSGKTTMIRCFDPEAHGREVPRYFYVDYELLKENPDLFPESNTATQTFDFTVVALLIGGEDKADIIKFSELTEEIIDDKKVKWVTIFYLFGTPGQWRFKDIRAFAERRSDGVIFIIDPIDPRLKENFEDFREQVIKNVERKVPIIYAVNKQDLPNVFSSEDLQKELDLSEKELFDMSALKCQNISRPIIALIKKMQEEELGKKK